jgi:hypothetical protein
MYSLLNCRKFVCDAILFGSDIPKFNLVCIFQALLISVSFTNLIGERFSIWLRQVWSNIIIGKKRCGEEIFLFLLRIILDIK